MTHSHHTLAIRAFAVLALAAHAPAAHAARCSLSRPCDVGGACLNTAECRSGLVCEGAIRNTPGTCERALRPGASAYCDTYGPCLPGEGSCDDDHECASGLVCTQDTGSRYGFAWDVDTCEYPPGHLERCTPLTPCDVGEGNCDTSADCLSGLVCEQDTGARYGFAATVNTCEHAHRNVPQCTPDTPCDVDEAGCNTDADCLDDLVCRQNVGTIYGYTDPATNVCAPREGARRCPEDYFPPAARQPVGAVRFRFPIDTSSAPGLLPVLFEPFVVHFDADRVLGTTETFVDLHFTYDNHEGTDYPLSASFLTQDGGSVDAVAAADGIVTRVVDGNPDRCAVDLVPWSPTVGQIQCDGTDPEQLTPNRVEVCHADGTLTSYLHLMNGSIGVEVGDTLSCGAPVGLVASSGRSSAPHLHFHVREPNGTGGHTFADPYAADPADSRWVDQGNVWTGLPAETCD